MMAGAWPIAIAADPHCSNEYRFHAQIPSKKPVESVQRVRAHKALWRGKTIRIALPSDKLVAVLSNATRN
jgi:hypothetical protein